MPQGMFISLELYFKTVGKSNFPQESDWFPRDKLEKDAHSCHVSTYIVYIPRKFYQTVGKVSDADSEGRGLKILVSRQNFSAHRVKIFRVCFKENALSPILSPILSLPSSHSLQSFLFSLTRLRFSFSASTAPSPLTQRSRAATATSSSAAEARSVRAELRRRHRTG